jgi:hypothetical protein
LAQEQGRSARETKLESEIEILKVELSKEKSERSRIDRELHKAASELEGQNSVLEARVDGLRTKLKTAKEQLKDTQAELDNVRKENDRLTKEKRSEVFKEPRKRSFPADVDATIGTPDGFPMAKRQRVSALPGDKSNFSITPFLNRTVSFAPETPVEAIIEAQEDIVPVQKEQAPIEQPIASSSQPVAAEPAKKKARQPKAKPIAKKPLPKLDELREEDEETQDPAPQSNAPPTQIQEQQEQEVATTKPQVKKKRRVLGNGPGKTLFDDDDAIPSKANSRGGLDELKYTMTKRINLAPKTGAAAGRGKVSAMSGFGDFSPLKKDRKP